MIHVADFDTLAYMAHRVRGDVEGNIKRGKEHLKRLQALYKPSGVHIIAPWLYECQIYDDADEEQRAQGLETCKYTVFRCDTLFLIRHLGEPVSYGCETEGVFALEHGKKVREHVFLGGDRGYHVTDYTRHGIMNLTSFLNHVQATRTA